MLSKTLRQDSISRQQTSYDKTADAYRKQLDAMLLLSWIQHSSIACYKADSRQSRQQADSRQQDSKTKQHQSRKLYKQTATTGSRQQTL
jgi:hypothetical protein